MFNALKKLFDGGPSREKATPGEPADVKLAVAALLVEAARADGDYDDAERKTIVDVLQAQFDLDAAAATRLCADGEDKQAQALDIHQFSKIVKSELAQDDKVKLVERLWEVIYADGVKDSHEDYLVRRLIGLIYVSDRDSGAARKRVLRAKGLDL